MGVPFFYGALRSGDIDEPMECPIKGGNFDGRARATFGAHTRVAEKGDASAVASRGIDHAR